MSAFLLAEGGRIIRAERREDLRARAGLTEESLSALEAVCGKTAGETIHSWRQRLGQVDYLLEQELRSLDVK